MSVPNQRKIIVKRDSDDCRKDFFKVSHNNMYEAMYNLKPSSFLLWLYFCDNKNGYMFDLYSIDFVNLSGLSISTYSRAFDELLEKGYLLQHSTQSNIFLFKEKSSSPKIISTDVVCSYDINDFEKRENEFILQNDISKQSN